MYQRVNSAMHNVHLSRDLISIELEVSQGLVAFPNIIHVFVGSQNV